jgi:hypothetical protein
VVTSKVNHFSDLPTVKADTPEEIAQALEQLFITKGAKELQVNKQISYLNDNTWEKVALRHIAVFEE